jgi:hypothetical protein
LGWRAGYANAVNSPGVEYLERALRGVGERQRVRSRIRAWVVFELVIALALWRLPSHLEESLRGIWAIPTFGPPAAVLTALLALGVATLFAILAMAIATYTAKALGLDQSEKPPL